MHRAGSGVARVRAPWGLDTSQPEMFAEGHLGAWFGLSPWQTLTEHFRNEANVDLPIVEPSGGVRMANKLNNTPK